MNIIINSSAQNNYLYDEYIKDADLYRILSGAFKLDLGESLKLVRLLKYKPLDWDISDKSSCKEKLATWKRDLLIANSIIEKLRGNEYDEELYDYATKIDVEKLIQYKFDSDRFRKKRDYCINSSNEDKEKLLSLYESKFDIDVETEAILILVKKDLENNNKSKII